MTIGLISDTHGFLDDKVCSYFESCNEIWHIGDIGTIDVLDQLETFKPIRAVYGNIDSHALRLRAPENLIFSLEGKKFLLTHIAGKPTNYNPRVRTLIREHTPDVLICGHSHILRVEQDRVNNLLFINPGAAGRHGFHKKKTMIRFKIDQGRMYDMEVIELGDRARLD